MGISQDIIGKGESALKKKSKLIFFGFFLPFHWESFWKKVCFFFSKDNRKNVNWETKKILESKFFFGQKKKINRILVFSDKEEKRVVFVKKKVEFQINKKKGKTNLKKAQKFLLQ